MKREKSFSLQNKKPLTFPPKKRNNFLSFKKLLIKIYRSWNKKQNLTPRKKRSFFIQWHPRKDSGGSNCQLAELMINHKQEFDTNRTKFVGLRKVCWFSASRYYGNNGPEVLFRDLKKTDIKMTIFLNYCKLLRKNKFMDALQHAFKFKFYKMHEKYFIELLFWILQYSFMA